MKIKYEDEYGTELFTTVSGGGQSHKHIAEIGDTVIIAEEEYRVKGRTFFVEQDNIIITVTQNLVKSSQKEVDNSGRLAEMSNAIIQANKRQDVSEKKARALTEQVGGIRRHINQRIQQEKKDTP